MPCRDREVGRREGFITRSTIWNSRDVSVSRSGALDVRLPVPDRAVTRARRALLDRGCDPHRVRLVGIAPGAAYGAAKQWPPVRFAAVADHLAEADDIVCLLLGSPGDRPAARAVVESLDARRGYAAAGRDLDLVGQTDIELLMGLLGQCDVVVSNDSGAMHVAAVVGTPVVAVFGPTDERVTSPLGSSHRLVLHPVRCRPCLLRECPIDHRCMKGVTVEMVLRAVEEALDER